MCISYVLVTVNVQRQITFEMNVNVNNASLDSVVVVFFWLTNIIRGKHNQIAGKCIKNQNDQMYSKQLQIVDSDSNVSCVINIQLSHGLKHFKVNNLEMQRFRLVYIYLCVCVAYADVALIFKIKKENKMSCAYKQ